MVIMHLIDSSRISVNVHYLISKKSLGVYSFVETENGYYAIDSSRISENVHYLISKKSLGVYSWLKQKMGIMQSIRAEFQ